MHNKCMGLYGNLSLTDTIHQKSIICHTSKICIVVMMMIIRLVFEVMFSHPGNEEHAFLLATIGYVQRQNCLQIIFIRINVSRSG